MHWLLAIILRIIPASIICPVFIKKVVDATKDNYEMQVRKLNAAFLLCVSFSLFLCLILFYKTGENPFSYSVFIVMILGILNSMANIFKWRAVGIGLTKSYLFFGGKDIIAITLGFIFLDGTKLLNPLITFGIILSICAYLLMGLQNFNAEKKNQKEKSANHSRNLTLIGYAIGFFVIWGMLQFLEGVYAFKKLPVSQFIIGWYGGSYLGSLALIQIIAREKRKDFLNLTMIKEKLMIKSGDRFNVVMFSFSIWISLLLGYFAILKSHLNIALPVLMSAETILPCLLGLYYFKEKTHLTALEKTAVFTGFASAILIAIGY